MSGKLEDISGDYSVMTVIYLLVTSRSDSNNSIPCGITQSYDKLN